MELKDCLPFHHEFRLKVIFVENRQTNNVSYFRDIHLSKGCHSSFDVNGTFIVLSIMILFHVLCQHVI